MIIHSDAECAYDVQRLVRAAKQCVTDGLSGSDFTVRLEAAQEAEYWVKAVSALIFWAHADCLGVCRCESNKLPVMLKVKLD